MKCGVITPIGPGHADLARQAESSVLDAVQHSKGSFDDIEWFPVEDPRGELGRSRARNIGIDSAREAGCDWLFFLDADDLIAMDAFDTVSALLDQCDAVWGAICELKESGPALRDSQVLEIKDYAALITHDPYLTLQMGHFVKASCLEEKPFDETLDTGEDFKYYLALWKSHRCIKIPKPLFVNRRGQHSTGPRSASGREWGEAARKLIAEARAGRADAGPQTPNGEAKDRQPPGKEEQPFRYTYSQGLGELFEQLDITLLVTTYQAGKLCVFRSRQGKISMLPRSFKKAMGVAADARRMAVATQHEIWFLQNETVIAPKVEPRDTYDACYIPRRSHVTSNIDLHEIAWGGDQLWLVNTLFSCLATIENRSSFVPRWHPPFVSALSRHDRCHLNGLAMQNGMPAYVTMFAQTDTPQGWREHKLDGGIIMHVGSGEVVARGLSMPHSPRIHGGRLWALDSGNGRLVCVDAHSGHVESVVQFDSYPRGLAFCGCFAFVGLSKVREKRVFGGVPIADNDIERHCGVAVVDLRRGVIAGKLEFERSVEEIFDVQILEGIRYPTVIGFDQDTIERAALIESLRPLEASPVRPLPVSDKAAAKQKITDGLQYLKADFKEEAAACFRQAVQLAPDFPKALNNLGYVLLELEDVDGAIENCRQAVRYDPDYPLARNNLGNAYRANKENEKARAQYEAAIRLRPDYPQALHNLGVILIDMNEPEQAKTHLRRALALQPGLAVSWNRLGTACARTGEFGEALACHQRAVECEPGNNRLKADLASCLADSGRLQDSVDAYRKLQQLEPDNLDDRKDLAMVLLKKGDFVAGWEEYDSRLMAVRTERVKVTPEGEQVRVSTPLPTTPRCVDFPQPRWSGEPLAGRRILIWSEQGIGDEFMFASMYSEIIEQAGSCLIECDVRTHSLLSRSFPTAEFVATSTPPQPPTQAADIDFQSAMGSLGRWLRHTEESFHRAKRGYFQPDEARAGELRARYSTDDVKAVVGIAFRTANPASAWMRNADMALWHSVLAQAGVRFVCLQYGDCTKLLNDVKEATGVEVFQDTEIDPITDVDGFAAQVAAMDLVLSIDNSTVHLAGALDVPVWTLLPYSPDWRWMLNRQDSVWYPSMRLFRQPSPGQWRPVFDEVAGELRQFIAGRTAEHD